MKHTRKDKLIKKLKSSIEDLREIFEKDIEDSYITNTNVVIYESIRKKKYN